MGKFEAVESLTNMEMRNECGLFFPKEEEKYTISKADEILLYGYNEYCKQQVDGLLQEGYTVTGIIDQNAANIAENYRGVCIVNSIFELNVSERSVLFVMLQNGMLHWDVAFNLYKNGIERIVFLPMCEESQDSILQEFILQYNYMINGDYAVMKVPYLCDSIFEKSIYPQFRMAQILDNGEYIVWMSAEMIRTTLKEEKKYRDVPIAEFTPYVRLFLFLGGRNNIDISEYVRLYGKAPYSAESIEAYHYTINKRRNLYDFFESKYCDGNMEYFEAAAPRVAFNDNGYVNLCEGQHRCIYLLSKGMKKVPVRITEDILGKLIKRV